jgi:hypothetical protein
LALAGLDEGIINLKNTFALAPINFGNGTTAVESGGHGTVALH